MADSKNRTRIAVIMAGGAGERFWPVSRHDRPKQLLPLGHGGRSLLQEAVARITPLIPAERVYIVTGKHLVEPIRAANVGVPDENVLGEPCKRNTAGCLLYATAHILAATDEPADSLAMAVLTADHLIGEDDRFRQSVTLALSAAEEFGALVTHGIVPQGPDTAFGYVEALESEGAVVEESGIPVYRVGEFHEKPDVKTAEKYVAAGNVYWNSGMFFWTVASFVRELAMAQPDMAETLAALIRAMRDDDAPEVQRIFEGLDNVSIDHVLMEKAEDVFVTRADYAWDDVGSWSSLERTRTPDENGNVVDGKPVLIDSHNSIVYNAAGAERMAVSVIGMDNVVVVASEDGVLVVPKDRAQDVRQAVAELKKRDSKHL